MSRTSKLAIPLLLVLAAAGLAGCLTVDNGDGPILSIELFWDARPQSATFAPATCSEAGVVRMEWALFDEDGEMIAENSERCADAIDVFEPDPGEYELDITGYDEDDEALWSVTCTGLRVLRFDAGFACDIRADASSEITE